MMMLREKGKFGGFIYILWVEDAITKKGNELRGIFVI